MDALSSSKQNKYREIMIGTILRVKLKDKDYEKTEYVAHKMASTGTYPSSYMNTAKEGGLSPLGGLAPPVPTPLPLTTDDECTRHATLAACY